MDNSKRQESQRNHEHVKLAQEIRKLRFEQILQGAAIVYIAAFSFGAILMYFYFIRNEFSPGGISAADTVLFSLISVGFLFTLFGAICIGTLIAYPVVRGLSELYWCFEKMRPSDAEKKISESDYEFEWDRGNFNFLVVVLGVLTIAFLTWTMSHFPLRFSYFLPTLALLGVFPSGLLFGTYKKRSSQVKQREDLSSLDRWMNGLSPRLKLLVITTIVTSIASLYLFTETQDISFTWVGVRKNNVNVRLSREDFELISRQALMAGIPLNPCEQIDLKDPFVRGADIVSQRIGTQALVRYPSVPIGELKKIRTVHIEPSAANVSLVEGPSMSNVCFEFPRTMLFGPARDPVFRRNAVERLDHKFEGIDLSKSTFALRALYNGAERSEATKEMEFLKRSIVERYSVRPEQVKFEILEKAPDKWDCSQFPASAQKYCRQANVRTEIEVSSSD
ncbi:hypothetical protein ACN9MZ_07815 [Pseudoduganella sp. S-14]|uniref:hypothetical protein n=1 Tax=Pseudoduganella sp. S-14 TaxID=3404065 RepID=UPI003CF28924